MVFKKMIKLFALLLMPTMAWAGVVSQDEARLQAEAFMQQRGRVVQSAQMHRVVNHSSRRAPQKDGGNSCYMFNIGSGQGFVVVSGDDRTPAILGYADSGSIDADNMPDGLRYLLDGYAEQMEWLESNASAAQRHNAPVRSAVQPIIQTQWDQGAPYNNLCPENASSVRTVTGCVATAMAQMMFYHQCPTGNTTAIPAYTTRTLGLEIEALSATTFSWSAMTPNYTKDATGAAADAVAELMRYCGQSLQMNYNISSVGGSSAYNASIASALCEYFGYDVTAAYVQRQHYSYQQWVDLIYAELAADRPVLLGGQSTGGGHSFVCDGYDAEDYFHINWGWSGNSDGYFRLSALNPYVQGIGGSSTLDGFSYSQDAVIGIRPYAGTAAAKTLSLEYLQFDNTGTQQTVIVNADANANNQYTISSLYGAVCNYSFSTTNFDYVVQLTQADGTLVSNLYTKKNLSCAFNVDYTFTLSGITLGGLADGTYYIRVMCRETSETTWRQCYDGEQMKIMVTLSNGVMTLSAPVVRGSATLPASVSFNVSGDKVQGHEQTVTASVTGGTIDYHGNLILRVDGTAVMGKSVDIPAGQTVDVSFAFIPATAGTHTLSLWNAKTGGTQIGSNGSVDISASDATSDLLLTATYVINNEAGENQLYGHALRATVTVSNASTEKSFAGQMTCSVRQWTLSDDGQFWHWQSIAQYSYPLIIGKNSSSNVELAIDNLPATVVVEDETKDCCYTFRLTYRRADTVTDLVQIGADDNGAPTLTVTDGYRLGDKTGATTIYPVATPVNAGSACFVDLRYIGETSGLTVTPSSNPNCVYLLAGDAEVPTGLSACNVVKGSAADRLTLTDGRDFYTPIAFTAAEATYTRTFTLAAAGTSGWNTLCLPFNVSAVSVNDGSVGGKEVTWFTSDDDTNGSFWLREFASDGEGTVGFTYAQTLTAGTPYIIAVPGTTWGDEYRMTDPDRAVTFSGSNVAIAATATTGISGNHYRFNGSTVGSSLTDVYMLNAMGSRFYKKSGAIDAFRAWFSPVSISSLTLPSLAIGNAETNGISDLQTDDSRFAPDAVYTLQGQRISKAQMKPGHIYIMNGKKITKAVK